MVQKVLVTGATRFIGIEVSRQLAERGMRPRLMVRRPVRGLMLRSLEAEIMQADIRSSKSLDRILKGMDTVIHLGARAAFEPYPRLRVTHTSRNNPILAVITLGSGWHNNHQHYVVSARQGFFWWELDITYYALALLVRLEIIRELRPVSEYLIHQNLIVD
ncbi:MAG: NAD-dependent epimerase/dehydratase family protein [Desulfobacterales bacterium]|jgi:uncharacterized protein YbjT (DUF2867 family)